MPLLDSFDYKPPRLLKNSHLNTFYPYFFRKKPSLNFVRERIYTPDADFFDIDTLFNGHRRLTILCHGLEGSSASQYISGTTNGLKQNNWDVIAINFRSCSGEMNWQKTLYHSGFTQDLHLVLNKFKDKYDELAIIGFSLGGNVVMKYISDGLYDFPSNLIAAAGVSVPCDLAGGSLRIAEKQNFLYQKRFLISLSEKMIGKAKLFPESVDIEKLSITRTLLDFDDYFTSRLHGFKDADDYYAQCNSLQFLHKIEIPALIINALDDSFLPSTSFPVKQAQNNSNLFLMMPKYGGHVGFTTKGTSLYWNEQKILWFFNQYSKAH